MDVFMEILPWGLSVVLAVLWIGQLCVAKIWEKCARDLAEMVKRMNE